MIPYDEREIRRRIKVRKELGEPTDDLEEELEKFLLLDEIDFDERFETGEQQNIMGWVYDVKKKRYIRVRRVIYSKFWNAIHNLIAHPMLAIYRPWGEWLHEWTATKMYEGGPQSLDEVHDQEIAAVMD